MWQVILLLGWHKKLIISFLILPLYHFEGSTSLCSSLIQRTSLCLVIMLSKTWVLDSWIGKEIDLKFQKYKCGKYLRCHPLKRNQNEQIFFLTVKEVNNFEHCFPAKKIFIIAGNEIFLCYFSLKNISFSSRFSFRFALFHIWSMTSIHVEKY